MATGILNRFRIAMTTYDMSLASIVQYVLITKLKMFINVFSKGISQLYGEANGMSFMN